MESMNSMVFLEVTSTVKTLLNLKSSVMFTLIRIGTLQFVCLFLLQFVYPKNVYYSSRRNKEVEKLSQDGFRKWSMQQSIDGNPDCWAKAFSRIEGNCLDMSREEKLLFSWGVFHCYYEDTGRHLNACDKDLIRSCIRDLPSSEFNIYTQFYNHADSMCFYRESKEWQERTDRTVQHLEKAAEQTNSMLEESIAKEKELISLQQRHLELHSESLQQGAAVLETVTEAGDQLEELSNSMKTSFSSIKNETDQFFQSFRDMLQWTNDKIEAVSGFQTVVANFIGQIRGLFYVTCQVVIVFLITSIPAFSIFRPYFYLLVIMHSLVQQCLQWMGVSSDNVRWIAICIQVFVMGVSFFCGMGRSFHRKEPSQASPVRLADPSTKSIWSGQKLKIGSGKVTRFSQSTPQRQETMRLGDDESEVDDDFSIFETPLKRHETPSRGVDSSCESSPAVIGGPVRRLFQSEKKQTPLRWSVCRSTAKKPARIDFDLDSDDSLLMVEDEVQRLLFSDEN